MEQIDNFIDKVEEKINDFFDEHCLYFWHDYKPADPKIESEILSRYPSGERWYWDVEQCSKCESTRMVMKT